MRYPTQLFSLLLLTACGGSPPALQVGDVDFSMEAVSPLSPEDRLRLADLAALGQAIARDETGPLGDPLVHRARERSHARTLPLHLAARAARIDDARLRELYGASPEWELTVRHLVRLVRREAPGDERRIARDRAENAWRRAAAGENFAMLAAEFSEEPGAAERGGLLDPGRQGSWVGPFWEAALSLQEGDISPVVETEYGYHVIRLERRERVPFNEADRARLLSSLVSPAQAHAALENWVMARAGSVTLDEDAVARWLPLIRTGSAPDSVVLGGWTGGLEGGSEGRYTAWDAALLIAALDGEERDRLDRGGMQAYSGRLHQDAREAMLAADARGLGVPEAEHTAREARAEWQARIARWRETFSFRSGTGAEEIRRTTLRAVAARGQEERIAREDLAGIRPLLRSNYRVSGPLAPASAAASSSETP
jgi:hypothetical protein